VASDVCRRLWTRGPTSSLTIRSTPCKVWSSERSVRAIWGDRVSAPADWMVNEDVGPLVQSLRQTSDATQSAVGAIQASIGEGSIAQHNLLELLDELTRTARSFRTLADTLEQNPESLIRGKGDGE
ncbi:MAG: hypothetical protein AAFX99_25485, partial [Myxococcota bacterium]